MSQNLSSLHALFSSTWGIVMMVVLLEGSIFVHELGHYWAAKWRGLKIDKFSLGFGPKVLGWTNKAGVEFRLSLLPLGGYVALPQFLEVRALEGEPSEDAANLPPLSYADKMWVAIAGVVFNILFAFFLACVLWVVGLPTPEALESNVLGYVAPKIPGFAGQPDQPGPAYTAGLQPGDRVLAVDGKVVGDFRDLQMAVALGAGRTPDNKPLVHFTFERNGKVQEVNVEPLLLQTNTRAGDAIRQIGVEPAQKLVVDEVKKNSPAQLAGLKAGDEVVEFNGRPLYSPGQFIDQLSDSGTTPATLGVLRDGQRRKLTVAPEQLPSTTPLATLTAGDARKGVEATKLDILPVYADDSKDNPALPGTEAAQLRVWRIVGNPEMFGDLKPGDVITSVNGQKPHSVQALVEAFQATPPGASAAVTFLDEDTIQTTLVHTPFTANVTPPVQVTIIGVIFSDPQITVYLTPWKQFGDALGQTVGMIKSLLNPHSDVGLNMLSGAVGMGRALEHFAEDDIRLALWFTVLINISLAILNLLPIPVLDGGHILLATITRLRGRALPTQVVVTTQGVFLVLLMGLMMYVLFNDSRRWMGDNDEERALTQERSYYLKLDFSAKPVSAPVTKP